MKDELRALRSPFTIVDKLALAHYRYCAFAKPRGLSLGARQARTFFGYAAAGTLNNRVHFCALRWTAFVVASSELDLSVAASPDWQRGEACPRAALVVAILRSALPQAPPDYEAGQRSRYATALEQQADLDRYLDTLHVSTKPKEIGAYVSSLFADTPAELKAIVQRQLTLVSDLQGSSAPNRREHG
jgi:hypothetical protein